MKVLFTTWILTAVFAGSLAAAPPLQRPPPHKNRTIAFLAGVALHLSQNARALQSASLKKREKAYGPDDRQVRAGHKYLRMIHQKLRYFRHVKRSSEGRRPQDHKL